MKEPKLSDLKYDEETTLAIREAMAQAKKVKITINFDSDVLEDIKKMAKEQGSPYQTLLNKIVRDSVGQIKNESSRLDRLEKEIEKLKKKIG